MNNNNKRLISKSPKRKIHIAFYVLALPLLASCSSSYKAPTADISSNKQVTQPAQIDNIDTTIDNTDDPNTTLEQNSTIQQESTIESTPLFDNVSPFKQEQEIAAGETQVSQAQLKQPSLTNLQILIQQQQYTEAQNLLSRIDRNQLSLQDLSSLSLAEAQIYSAQGQNEFALSTLNTIQPSLLPLNDSSRYFWLKARTQYLMGDTRGALESLAERENYLSQDEIVGNQTMMNNIMKTLSAEEIETIAKTTLNPSLIYWLNANRYIASDTQNLQLNLPQQGLANSAQITSNWTVNSPRSIAILLPFNSRFGTAAKEFEKGFRQAHQENPNTVKPVLRFYDTGNSDIASQLNLAIQSGADFIIGPLGKTSSETALNYQLPIPIMTIGGSINNPSLGKYTFSLTPEAEAVAIAEHARSQNYQNAVILTSNASEPSRFNRAFQQAWQSLGGSLQSHEFSKGEYDHSVIVKTALGIYGSESRFNQLAGVLGSSPKFNASRKGSIDMILLDSSYADARNLKPQLNFFDGNSLPTYGPSSINAANAPDGEKADLDGLIIPEMPALLSSQTTPEPGVETTDSTTQFSRLSALGYDSYSLIPIIENMKNQQSSFQGKTGQLILDSYSNIFRRPSWVKFSNGQLIPLNN